MDTQLCFDRRCSHRAGHRQLEAAAERVASMAAIETQGPVSARSIWALVQEVVAEFVTGHEVAAA